MRREFCDALCNLIRKQPLVFLTGDLGFMALEPLRDTLGENFINAGVAEQNMISVAAGLSKSGLSTWVYSIAPFCYARPFEQIRNDVCLHNLPVKIIGNGGGYGYGVMGASHHALEDYGTLLALQNIRVLIPAFSEDVGPIIDYAAKLSSPAYIRLGRDEKPTDANLNVPYSPWRKIIDGEGPIIVSVGSITGSLIKQILSKSFDKRPELWVVSELPLEASPPPAEFLCGVKEKRIIAIVEEHVVQGSFGHQLSYNLVIKGLTPIRLLHFASKGYVSGYYGSQEFHRNECGLSPEFIIESTVKATLNA